MFKTILAAVGAGYICFKLYDFGFRRGREAAEAARATTV